ncbi:MAG TPA: cyclic nucleotide-binding domain-containing protein [Acidobacteriota bacterium]|nr:cyclic nucleotide-binding domain-containing protein [Acidobacteriota bacterium]
MKSSALGRNYADKEYIIRQGEVGDCMYVVQLGKVEVVREEGGAEVPLAVLEEGDFFGEMALFEQDVRSATVRSLGESCVLTVDRKTLLGRVQEDPSLAFNILRTLSNRIRKLNEELGRATRGHKGT